MRRTIGLFKHCIRFGVFCYPVSHGWDFLSRRAAKPEKRPEQQSVRIKKYPEDAGRGPVQQSDASGNSSLKNFGLRFPRAVAVSFWPPKSSAALAEYVR
jgi:hypothetical protein